MIMMIRLFASSDIRLNRLVIKLKKAQCYSFQEEQAHGKEGFGLEL